MCQIRKIADVVYGRPLCPYSCFKNIVKIRLSKRKEVALIVNYTDKNEDMNDDEFIKHGLLISLETRNSRE
jgi:hypothetical protein